MTGEELCLAILSEYDGEWNSSQIQKILFILDRRIGQELGGPFWKQYLRKLMDPKISRSTRLSKNFRIRISCICAGDA